MRILFVSQMVPYLPCRDGFRIIPANVLRVLSRTHEIHLIALDSGDETVAERSWANDVTNSFEIMSSQGELALTRTARGSPETPFEERVCERIAELKPDVLHIEGTALAPLVRFATPKTHKLLSAHDSLRLRYREFARHGGLRSRLRDHALGLLAKRFERRWCPEFDRVVVTSDADRQEVTNVADTTPVSVIPNGVDLDFFEFKPTPTVGELVFTGNMSWRPNEDAARYFASEILPKVRAEHGSVRFSIVGADPSPSVRALAKLPGVHVTGTVPDVRPWVWQAAAYVGPLRFGAGVKNKILEAMALGAPVVATNSSFTGTPVVDGRHARIANTPAEFARALGELFRDGDARARLARAGRTLVETSYSWASVGARFEACYEGRAHEAGSLAR